MRNIIEYFITAETALLLEAESGNPNNPETADYVPGSSIRGAIAGKIAKVAGPKAVEDFVMDKNIVFTNAYPCTEGFPSLPIPFFLKRPKNTANSNVLFDTMREENLKESFVDLGASYVARKGSQGVFIADASIGDRLHHARDRKMGRATQDGGAMFIYSAIKPGAILYGQVILDGAASDVATAIMANLPGVHYLGKSRSASYGKARFNIGTADTSKIPFWDKPSDKVIKGDEILVVLTSDYIGMDSETGMNDPFYIKEELNARLGRSLEFVNWNNRTGVAGGFNNKWGMRLVQYRTLKKGSAFLAKVLDDITSNQFTSIEEKGLGIRREDGFGRVVFALTRDQNGNPIFEFPIHYEVPPVPSKATTGSSDTIDTIKRRAVDARVKELILQEIFEIVGVKFKTSPSLIGKLISLIKDGPAGFDALAERIRELKKDGRENLEKTVINGSNLFVFLRDFSKVDATPDVVTTCMDRAAEELPLGGAVAKFKEDDAIQYKWFYIYNMLRWMMVNHKAGQHKTRTENT